MTTTPTAETFRLTVRPTLIAHGFRWINASRAALLPRGTVVISRTSTLYPVAYVWPDGTLSARAAMNGSLLDSVAEPRDVIPAEKFEAYLNAAGIATRGRRYLTPMNRTALLRGVL